MHLMADRKQRETDRKEPGQDVFQRHGPQWPASSKQAHLSKFPHLSWPIDLDPSVGWYVDEGRAWSSFQSSSSKHRSHWEPSLKDMSLWGDISCLNHTTGTLENKKQFIEKFKGDIWLQNSNPWVYTQEDLARVCGVHTKPTRCLHSSVIHKNLKVRNNPNINLKCDNSMQ